MRGTNIRKGEMRVYLPTGAIRDEDDRVVIRIEDDTSGVIFFEAELTPAAWARCTVGNTAADIEFTLENTDLIGTKSENKTEFVPIIFGKDGKENKEVSLATFEVDGWKARSGDFGNHHRGSHRNGYSVVFFRHVRPDGTPVL